jgi:hypothetical protein
MVNFDVLHYKEQVLLKVLNSKQLFFRGFSAPPKTKAP